MEGEAGDGGPPGGEDLPSDRCPNCGGPLAFEPGRPEGHCSRCDIFVEILKPLPVAPDRPALVRADVLAATKKDLQELCRAYGLKVSGNKTDILTRVLRYMDEHGIDLPPDDVEEGLPEEEVLTIELGARDEHDLAVDELLEAVARVETAEAPREPVVTTARLRRDRRRFFVGILLTAIGGWGLLLGSLLHDVLRVPWIGEAYAVFGPLNQFSAIVGGVVLLIGLAGVALGLRGGVIPTKSAARG